MKAPRAALLAGTAETCPDILYITGFSAPDPLVVLVHKGKVSMVVSRLEYGRAKKTAVQGTAVFTPADLGLAGRDAGKLSMWAAALLKKNRLHSARVSPMFPLGMAKSLEEQRVRLCVEDGPLFPERQVKTTDELRKIAQTQRAAVAAMAAAVDVIQHAGTKRGKGKNLYLGGAPLTSARVRSYIEGVLLQLDCAAPDGTVVACGRQGADPHESGHGTLKAGELIVMDIFPRNRTHGYWGDLTRTVIKGSPSDAQRGLFEAVRCAQKDALSRIRPGVAACTVHNTAAKKLIQCGYKTERTQNGQYTGFIHSTGHGVGLEIHEFPSVSLNKDRLRSGNVVTVEPGLYYPHIGGVRIEDTVTVVPGKWRYLARCPMYFEI